ncbi:hypothetical protein [Georgenia sp. AZ-5]|uniref:hypothetical protein n=1 Tax=Georgenia sp. AZ-5 TaxID=3367526 RepID=UPI003753FB48
MTVRRPERIRVQDRLRLRIDAGDGLLPIDALITRSRSASTLVVSLHGYTDRATYSLPRFERLASFSTIDTHSLYISDPTITVDDRLSIGWYVGTPTDDLPLRLAELVDVTASKLRADRIVLTGSSGGGFAALGIAQHLPHANAVAFSPQTAVTRYHAQQVEALQDYVFTPATRLAAVEEARPGRLDLSSAFKHPRPGRLWYVQNAKDGFHVKHHLRPFAGSEPRGVDFFLEDHGPGHTPPSKERTLRWVVAALRREAPPCAPASDIQNTTVR